jgi:chorismate lyase/3-hydroxybenzoate synthase
MRVFTDLPRHAAQHMMELSPHIDRSALEIAVAGPALPQLRVGYELVAAERVLAESDVLAVIAFGSAAPNLVEPRYLRVGLEPISAASPLEVWRGSGPVERGRMECGTTGTIAWTSDGDYTFATIEVDEVVHGGIAGAARAAYAALGTWCHANAKRHVLRIWNYLDAINVGDGDDERYRLFCAGRAAGMDGLFAAGFPAATAIGTRNGRRTLQMYWLAARQPGLSMENPRQVSAWRYPRCHGPAAPNFARAMRAPTQSPQLYISGTAAVIGHVSHHAGDSAAQLVETLINLDSLFVSTGMGASAHFGARGAWKIYVRHADDAPLLQALLNERLGANTPVLLLQGDICRAELLVEIDGVQSV